MALISLAILVWLMPKALDYFVYQNVAASQIGPLPAIPYVWLDAAHVVMSGSNVVQMTDRSGNSRHFVQATPALGPTITSGAGGINGFPAIQGDGATQWLYNTSPGWYPLQHTAFYVISTPNTSGVHCVAGDSPDGTPGSSSNVLLQGKFSPGFEIATSTDNIIVSPVVATPFMVSYTYDHTTMTGLNGYYNGTSAFTSVSANGQGQLGNAVLMAAGNQHFWDGKLVEYIMYSGVLSTGDRQTVESYLRTKYGTP